MTGTKIYFAGQIYRILKLPDNLIALLEHIKRIFKDELPRFWKLHSIDSQGTQIAIYNDQDYLDLLEKEATHPNQTIKLHIVSEEGTTSADEVSFNDVSSNQRLDCAHKDSQRLGLAAEFEEILMEKGDRDVWDLREDNVNQISEDVMDMLNILSDKYSSQNNREKMAQAIQQDYTSPKNYEVLPRARPQPHDEGFYYKIRMHKAKNIIKKLAQGKFYGAKKEKMLEKLEMIKSSLPLALQEELRLKEERLCVDALEKCEEKNNRRHSHWHDCDNDEENYERLEKIVFRSRENNQRENLESDDTNQDTREFMSFSTLPGLPRLPSLPNQTDAEGKFVHHDVICSGCGMVPIVGIRYKCSECSYFDFCEECEATKKHPHLFLKMRESTLEPLGPIKTEVITVKESKHSLMDAFRKVKAFKITKGMVKAMKRGDTYRFNKLHNKLFVEFPKEAREVLDEASEWHPEGKEGLVRELKKFKGRS